MQHVEDLVFTGEDLLPCRPDDVTDRVTKIFKVCSKNTDNDYEITSEVIDNELFNVCIKSKKIPKENLSMSFYTQIKRSDLELQCVRTYGDLQHRMSGFVKRINTLVTAEEKKPKTNKSSTNIPTASREDERKKASSLLRDPKLVSEDLKISNKEPALKEYASVKQIETNAIDSKLSTVERKTKYEADGFTKNLNDLISGQSSFFLSSVMNACRLEATRKDREKEKREADFACLSKFKQSGQSQSETIVGNERIITTIYTFES